MTPPVLVVNAGSSSLKYQLVDVDTGTAIAKGSVERIGERSSNATHETGGDTHTVEEPIASHRDALAAVADAFREYGPSYDEVGLLAVGHRVVHGGDRLPWVGLDGSSNPTDNFAVLDGLEWQVHFYGVAGPAGPAPSCVCLAAHHAQGDRIPRRAWHVGAPPGRRRGRV